MIDWSGLLAVQGSLKSLLQHHSSKASILRHSAFFMVHLSQPYMITGKTIALTRQTFVGQVMSLLFNCCLDWSLGFPYSSVGKESACNAGDLGSIPGCGRSPGEGNDNPLQYSCLGNPAARGAWRAIVPGVTKESDTTWRLYNSKAELTTLPPLLSGCEGSMKSDT